MTKLENIKQFLADTGEVTWDEQSAKREHLRKEGEFYWVTGLQVAPGSPIPDSEGLQRFSRRIVEALMPLDPSNVSQCYEYAETRRDVVKTAALYFTELIETDGSVHGLENRIAVGIYPCRMTAEALGIRATIDLGHFPCPHPCEKARTCEFRVRHDGFIYYASRR